MTNYNERLDDVLDFVENYGVSASTEGFDKTDSRAKLKQAITSLTKELVAEAKPSPDRYVNYNSDCLEGYNLAIKDFEQNLLKALEEV